MEQAVTCNHLTCHKSETAINTQTDNANENRVGDTLTYQSFGVDAWNGQGMKMFFSGDAKFDKAKMLAEVAGGYAEATTPSTSN